MVQKTAYYQLGIEEDVRVITIAPDYDSFIFKALKNVKNTELMIYRLDNKDLLQIVNYTKNEATSIEYTKF